MTSESPLLEFVEDLKQQGAIKEEIEQGKADKDRPCDYCGAEEEVSSIRDSVTGEVDVSICDACVLSGAWRDEVDGASKTVLLAYAGALALRD